MSAGDGRLLGAALDLAALGWSVVPVHSVADGRCSCRRRECPSPGKHPRVRWERAMSRPATPSEIEIWWERWPGANVGVVTGWVSGLVVVDVDPRHGGDDELAALESRHGLLPATITSTTGGGGRHVWLAHPPHLVPSRPLASGLDLKAEGGLVIAPPSRHVSGAGYEWCAGRAPGEQLAAPLPDWLDHLSVTVADDGPNGDPYPISRTATERAAFADLWADVGISLGDVETMVRCPFHDDHRPSLHVDPTGCRWFCFGCRRGGGLQALRRIVRPETTTSAHRSRSSRARELRPTLAPEVTIEVVGEGAHQDELLALCGGRRTWSGAHELTLARLEPDDDNPFDPEAVTVTIEGRLVGHLPRPAARTYRPIITAAIADGELATCLAEIRGGWERGHGDVGRFGVVLSLPRVPG